MGSGILLTLTMRMVPLQHLLTLFSDDKLLFLSRMRTTEPESRVPTEVNSSDCRLVDSSGDLMMKTQE